MVYYAGIDLGKRQSQVRIIGTDRKVVEDLRVDNDPKEIRPHLPQVQGRRPGPLRSLLQRLLGR